MAMNSGAAMITRLMRCTSIYLNAAILAVALLAGCNSSTDQSTQSSNDIITTDISGSIGDGPVVDAQVVIYNRNGSMIGTATSSNTASFKSTIKAKGKDYPLLLETSGGIDLVTSMPPDFVMLSVLTSPSQKYVNINPFTTLIVKIALNMPGGISAANIQAATSTVTGEMGFGLDTTLVDDPMYTKISDSNISNVIKSCEAIGESVRRTRDAISSSARIVSADDILDAVAADLADGELDGSGSGNADPLVAVITKLVSGKVLLEALSNDLRVGGQVATAAMDQSILITRPGLSGAQLTDSVRITAGMLAQTSNALEVAQLLDPDARIRAITGIVSGLSAGAYPDEVAALLPAATSSYLDNAIMLASIATEEELTAFNQGSGVANTAPRLTGIPVLSVTANELYTYQPHAVDPDGDSLIFTVDNMPYWASFDATTGQLSGMPSDADVGTYGGIVISVNDGLSVVNLPAFSIHVAASSSAAGTGTVVNSGGTSGAFVPFSADSYWNKPLPPNAPVDSNSDLYIAYAKDQNVSDSYLGLTGAPGANQSYAAPIVWSTGSDPLYTIVPGQYGRPVNVRIPLGAQPQTGSDGALWVVDRTTDLLVQLWQASFNGSNWSAASTSQYRISSNGLHRKAAGSDSPENDGHRGIPPNVQMIRLDEVRAGAIEHRLACYWHATGRPDSSTPWYYWPMVGYESNKGGITPEGLVIRIKPGVDLSQKSLSPVAAIIATALQRYGCIIGDNSGGTTNRIKLEYDEAAWAALDPELRGDALSSLTWDDWEFIQGGYNPPAP